MSAAIRSILFSSISKKGRPFSSISEKGRPFSLIYEKGRLFCSKVSSSPLNPPPSPAAVATADQSWVKQPMVSPAANLIAGQRSPPIPSPPPSVQVTNEVDEKRKVSAQFANHNHEDDPSDFNKFKALAHANAAAEDLTRIDEDIACFESWALKIGRVYESMEEKLHRFEVFKGTLKYIERANKENRGFTVGLTNFADVTNEEFCRMHNQSGGHHWYPPRSVSSRVHELFLYVVDEKRHLAEFADYKPNVEDYSSEFNKFKALAHANAAAEDLTRIDEDIACFESWALKWNAVYESMEEKLQRFEVFKDRLKYIEKSNKENVFCTVGLNNLSDITEEEFNRWYLFRYHE